MPKDDARMAGEEGRKLQYDSFKHLTTLSTGSILLFITFVEKVSTGSRYIPLIIIAFVAFILSILASLVMMTLIARIVRKSNEVEEHNRITGKIFIAGFSISGGGFLLGVICFLIFAAKNLLG